MCVGTKPTPRSEVMTTSSSRSSTSMGSAHDGLEWECWADSGRCLSEHGLQPAHGLPPPHASPASHGLPRYPWLPRPCQSLRPESFSCSMGYLGPVRSGRGCVSCLFPIPHPSTPLPSPAPPLLYHLSHPIPLLPFSSSNFAPPHPRPTRSLPHRFLVLTLLRSDAGPFLERHAQG